MVRHFRGGAAFRVVIAAITFVVAASHSMAQDAEKLGAATTKPDDTLLARQWARRSLLDSVIERFEMLANQPHRLAYSQLKQHKAGALCLVWPPAGDYQDAPVWGGAWDCSTVYEATTKALAECEKAKADSITNIRGGNCKCDILYRDDEVVLEPPASVIDKMVSWVNSLVTPTMCANWFTDEYSKFSPLVLRINGACPGYDTQNVDRLHFVIADVLSNAEEKDSPNIFPPPPAVTQTEINARHITIPSNGLLTGSGIRFYPPTGDDYIGTWSTPFTLPMGWEYEFHIHRVPPQRLRLVLSQLKSIAHSKMYGRFGHTLSPGVELPYFNASDEFARYARAYDLANKKVYESFDSLEPELSRDGQLYGERSKRLWVESSIPVDKHWIPVGQPLRTVVPIAVQTDRALYLYSIEVVPEKSGGGTMDHLEGRVFDLSACGNTSRCVQDAERVLVEELIKSFQQDPLAAPPARNTLSPPSQLRFQRITEKSKVLSGMAGPYFEMSTYTVTFWPGPIGDFLGTAELYFKTKADLINREHAADQLYLQAEQALQIAVGRKGSYEEPTPDQYAAYERAVNKAIQSAITRATARLGGKVGIDGVGKIPAEGALQ
jgi:hypothetical protein